MTDERNSKKLPGFYIALCCCVLAIGAAGYFTDRKENTNKTADNTSQVQGEAVDSNNSEGDVISVSEVIQTKTTASPTLAPTTAPISTPSATDTPKYAVDNPDIVAAAAPAYAEETDFIPPAGGDILAEYSSSLSFNEALGDYRTHNGIDIAADEGCSINASADGTVENVFSNAFGNGISISHSNGIVTKYMCLGSVEGLKSGDSVKAGDVIGTVGKSKGENIKEPHIHFEVFKDGKPVNPKDYLK